MKRRRLSRRRIENKENWNFWLISRFVSFACCEIDRTTTNCVLYVGAHLNWWWWSRKSNKISYILASISFLLSSRLTLGRSLDYVARHRGIRAARSKGVVAFSSLSLSNFPILPLFLLPEGMKARARSNLKKMVGVSIRRIHDINKWIDGDIWRHFSEACVFE